MFALNRGVADWPKIAAALILLYFAAFLLFATLTSRGLVADGANYYVSILETRAVYSPEFSRWTANVLIEFPMLVGLWLGIRDNDTLLGLFTLGQYYLAPASLVLCWFLLPGERKPLILMPLLSVTAGWMTSAYAGISQSQILALWFWPTAFAIAFLPLSLTRGGPLIAALVLPTILMHEGACLLCPFLAALALARLRSEDGAIARIGWIAIAIWEIAASVIGLYFTLVPIHPVARSDFIATITGLRFAVIDRHPNPPFFIALLSAGLGFIFYFWESLAKRYLHLWLWPFVAFLILAAFSPLILPRAFAPYTQSEARSWVVAVPLIVVVVAGIAYAAGLRRPSAAVRPLLLMILCLTLVSQITWQITATVRWYEFVEHVRGILKRNTGQVLYETAFAQNTKLGSKAYEVLASGWTFPHLSIALASDAKVQTIVTNPSWVRDQAFDPAQPAFLPRISWFDYGPYERAVR